MPQGRVFDADPLESQSENTPGAGSRRRHIRSPAAGVTSGSRRDAGSPLRQFEKRSAGIPIGGGAVSPLTSKHPEHTHDPSPAV